MSSTQVSSQRRHPTHADMLKAAELEFQAAQQKRNVRSSVGQAKRVTNEDGSVDAHVFRVANPPTDYSGRVDVVFTLVDEKTKKAFSIEETIVLDINEVIVRAPEVPEQASLLELQCTVDATMVPKALREYLKNGSPKNLAESFLQRALAAAGGEASVNGMSRSDAASGIGLNAEQVDALSAMTGDGIAVVWGPPGTGKTRVIGEAVNNALREGRSVLVASNTNVAVDNALMSVIDVSEEVQPGQIVRVGQASEREVIEHPYLTTRKVVALQNRKLQRKWDQLQGEIDKCKRSYGLIETELGRLPDIAEVEHVAQRIADLQRYEELVQQLRTATSRMEREKQEREQRVMLFDSAEESLNALKAYWDLPEVEDRLKQMQQSLTTHQQVVKEAKQALQKAINSDWWGRRRRKRDALLVVEQAQSDEFVCEKSVWKLRRRLEISESEGVAVGRVRQALTQHAKYAAAVKDSDDSITKVTAVVASTRHALQQLGVPESVSEADQDLWEKAERIGGITELRRIRAHHTDEMERLASRREEYEAELAQVEEKMAGIEAGVIKSARVIGTTLAQLVTNPHLRGRDFDTVIVDEVSAATIPMVYVAMNKARRSACLTGDFLQNGPISAVNKDSVEDSERPAAWLATRSCFELLKITDPNEAKDHAGCVVLRQQYRFGPRTTALLNELSYGDVLECRTQATFDEPEIVVVDMGDLGSLGEPKKGINTGKYWTAGCLVAEAISRQQSNSNSAIITPYRVQADLTRALVGQSDRVTPVGTVHSFQGREFEEVVLDLVEAGHSWGAKASWLIPGSSGDFARNGARLLTVGLSRHKKRVWILVNQRAINGRGNDRRGNAILLRKILKAPGVKVVSAQKFLKMQEPSAAASLNWSELGLAEFHDKSAPIVLDEGSFYNYLQTDLQRTSKSTAVYSPFVGERAKQVLPWLGEASERGVDVKLFVAQPRNGSSQLLDSFRLNVIERENLHEKAVLIDERISYVGSLNALSSTGNTSEIMFRIESEKFAAKLREQLRRHDRNRR
jgi:hypothetical protein